MCPFVSAEVKGCDDAIRHLPLCRNAVGGCNPARSGGLEAQLCGHESRTPGQTPPAHQESRCVLACSTTFSEGVLSERSTYREKEQILYININNESTGRMVLDFLSQKGQLVLRNTELHHDHTVCPAHRLIGSLCHVSGVGSVHVELHGSQSGGRGQRLEGAPSSGRSDKCV